MVAPPKLATLAMRETVEEGECPSQTQIGHGLQRKEMLAPTLREQE